MNIALLTAAGSGNRMQKDIPKQFLSIHNKPVILYTMEAFERNHQIDAILVVTLDAWKGFVRTCARQYGITKLRWVVTGGSTAQESIRSGVYFLEDICAADDIVVIHDGIRPLLDQSVLSDVIAVCRERGNAVSSLPYNEQIFIADDETSTVRCIPRETLRRVVTPQAYRFGSLDSKYHEAEEKGIGFGGSDYTNTMMVGLGERLYFAAGSEKNLKLTTSEDMDIFRALLAEKAGM